ncbi:3-hydroxyacyl-ACP dehydratase FabZ family protein [Adhaeretor mobilis]|uniref:3-hydroxyacyl-[acyl-carrier-protein] dehydratase FabZ n=1 Tax=Adhaeretor mobilis TaxID=1930276 RepID=A0A517MPY3_9BACT|nr:3-hydroxyacyl-ACP dehydratase FabZ family protein [Adhaeretor mobilis]QDS96837.1 3-hydroxyacyl-[acyl-carrier-protein] dehydratase FabZ [Adhaeretor mobilis]
MKFSLLDRICSFEPDTELTAVKNVTLSEEYLADHFPEFPVLPGVFMLEAATQASAWLVRLSEDFAHSIITLQEAKSLRFVDFVTPGKTLTISVQQSKREGNIIGMKFRGTVDDRLCVSGRLSVECANLADDDPLQAELDGRMIEVQRGQCEVLTRVMNAAEAVATV